MEGPAVVFERLAVSPSHPVVACSSLTASHSVLQFC